jgi:alkaline phosphatase
MKNLFILVLAILFVVPCAWGEEHSHPGTVQHVILLIADGCGFNHLKAAEYLNGKKQEYETWEVRFPMSTYPDGGGYDPHKMWNNFEYALFGATDSAAAATAMATGVKTRCWAIGVDPYHQPLENLVERAESLGMATGVVTTEFWTGATPAAFVAHNPDRNNAAEIAQEMLYVSPIDVIMGAGHPFYDHKGKRLRHINEERYEWVGKKATWEDLVSGKAGGDADRDGIPDPWTMIHSREEFQRLANGCTPKRILGIAQVDKGLQGFRGGRWTFVKSFVFNWTESPYSTPFIPTVPTLAEMTRAALNVLDDDPDGFFLMIEGAAIDDMSHRKHLGRTIEELNDFNGAVQAVVAWIEARSNWDETLVIVTSDHETGHLWGPGSGTKRFNPLGNRGRNNMPAFKYYSNDHSNTLVPLFAKGCGSDRFNTYATNVDDKMGPYIDNTAIAQLLFELYTERE